MDFIDHHGADNRVGIRGPGAGAKFRNGGRDVHTEAARGHDHEIGQSEEELKAQTAKFRAIIADRTSETAVKRARRNMGFPS